MKFRYGALISVATVVLAYCVFRIVQGATVMWLTALGMVCVIISTAVTSRKER